MSSGPAFFGRDFFGKPVTFDSKLRERYVAPPFSVLDAGSGDWQARKRAWKQIGLKSEVGRPDVHHRMKALAKYMGNGATKNGQAAKWIVTSIFDPVLCECAYRWWCPEGGQIIDPFAGGSVRGIVAGVLGYHYWGCDLSKLQIDANEEQANEIPTSVRPVWVCGDSDEKVLDAPMADFLFSCPPYGDLEVYSNDPKDISNMKFEDFAMMYKRIIMKSCSRLKDDRFACFVIGDYRDTETGFMRNMISGTIRAFKESGMGYYNEMILKTVPGTAMVRATRVFNAGRKCVKTHQNILVFCKGSWKRATEFINDSMATPLPESVKKDFEEIDEAVFDGFEVSE
jgi:hypothetical protein